MLSDTINLNSQNKKLLFITKHNHHNFLINSLKHFLKFNHINHIY
jgi:hypothetical protein